MPAAILQGASYTEDLKARMEESTPELENPRAIVRGSFESLRSSTQASLELVRQRSSNQKVKLFPLVLKRKGSETQFSYTAAARLSAGMQSSLPETSG